MIRYVVTGWSATERLVYLETYLGWSLYKADSYAKAFLLARYFKSHTEAKRARNRARRLFPAFRLYVNAIGSKTNDL